MTRPNDLFAFDDALRGDSSRPPSVPFYGKDWLMKTAGLSLEEEACYLRLWNAARNQSPDWCSLPDDDPTLARIVRVGLKRWKKLRPAMVPQFFCIENGRLVNERLRVEAEIQRNRRNQQSVAGKISAEKRATDVQHVINGRSSNVQHPAQRDGQREVNPETATESPRSRSLSASESSDRSNRLTESSHAREEPPCQP